MNPKYAMGWTLAVALLGWPGLHVGALQAAEGTREHFTTDRTPALPFSDAVKVGHTLYVGGHLGLDPQTQQAPKDPELEARLVMESVKETLGKAGYDLSDLVSVTVYCTDLELYAMFNRIYAGYFKGHYPARAFIGAGSLLRGAHFEVMGVAVRN